MYFQLLVCTRAYNRLACWTNACIWEEESPWVTLWLNGCLKNTLKGIPKHQKTIRPFCDVDSSPWVDHHSSPWGLMPSSLGSFLLGRLATRWPLNLQSLGEIALVAGTDALTVVFLGLCWMWQCCHTGYGKTQKPSGSPFARRLVAIRLYAVGMLVNTSPLIGPAATTNGEGRHLQSLLHGQVKCLVISNIAHDFL